MFQPAGGGQDHARDRRGHRAPAEPAPLGTAPARASSRRISSSNTRIARRQTGEPVSASSASIALVGLPAERAEQRTPVGELAVDLETRRSGAPAPRTRNRASRLRHQRERRRQEVVRPLSFTIGLSPITPAHESAVRRRRLRDRTAAGCRRPPSARRAPLGGAARLVTFCSASTGSLLPRAAPLPATVVRASGQASCS